MSKKRPSYAEARNLAHWSTAQGRAVQDYCCESSMPAGAIKADLSKQAPHNSYGPPMWYADRKVKCKDCGREFTWTATAQKRWFEVLKRPIWAVAVRCVLCARKARLAKEVQKRHMAEIAKLPKRRSR